MAASKYCKDPNYAKNLKDKTWTVKNSKRLLHNLEKLLLCTKAKPSKIDRIIKSMGKANGKKKNKDPKKGTGKKPKGSGRRLYTDENPKDTVSIKFATPADARATVAKVKKLNKPFARKIQILTVGEQRAKVMKKSRWLIFLKKVKKRLEN